MGNSIPVVSIIVPVFNTGQYLSQCIESILSQSYCSFELLLIDDGSTDESGAICDEYAKKDSRIRVFHKENGGVSSARNLGLDHASGEWIYFVDSDDQVLPGGLQTMVDCISNDVDIVLAGYKRYDETGHVVYEIDERVVCLMDKQESLSTLYARHGKYYDYLTYGCIRLLRNKIIQKHNLRFDIEISNKEDTLFLTQYICQSNGRTRFTTTPVYRYNLRNDSAMGAWKKGFDYKYIDSLYALIKMRDEIHRVFSSFCEIVFIADEGVWIRYNIILDRMKSLNIQDDDLKSRMYRDVHKALRPQFFIRKKLRNRMREWFHSN